MCLQPPAQRVSPKLDRLSAHYLASAASGLHSSSSVSAARIPPPGCVCTPVGSGKLTLSLFGSSSLLASAGGSGSGSGSDPGTTMACTTDVIAPSDY
jgi:hypothetical protein